MPTGRNTLLGLGIVGGVLAAAHAYAFRVILAAFPADASVADELLVLAGHPMLAAAWILAALGMWTTLIALLPAIWRALGGDWPASAAVAIIFGGAIVNIAGDGSQLPTLNVSAQYAGAEQALRPGMAAAAAAASETVVTVLTVGLIVLAAGLLAAAVVSAIRPPRVGRWYGLLFVVAGIANVPIGPAEIAAVLNFVVFLGIAYVTARELALRGTPEYRVSGA